MIQGNKNTRFFHASTISRRGRNKIMSIKDNVDNWIFDATEIASFLRQGYVNLVSFDLVSTPRNVWRPLVGLANFLMRTLVP